HSVAAVGVHRRALPIHRRDDLLRGRRARAQPGRQSVVRVGSSRHLRRPVVAAGVARGPAGRRAVQLLGPRRAEGARSVARGWCPVSRSPWFLVPGSWSVLGPSLVRPWSVLGPSLVRASSSVPGPPWSMDASPFL